MLQKATSFSCKGCQRRRRRFSNCEIRISTTRGYSMNWRSRRSRYSRLSEVFLNDIGNWMSSAPSRPSPAIASRPSRVRISSSSVGRMVAAEVAPSPRGRVREGAIKFGREEKILVHRRDLAAPEFRPLRFQRPIKRCVDLGRVEKVRQIFQRMLLAAATCPEDRRCRPTLYKTSPPYRCAPHAIEPGANAKSSRGFHTRNRRRWAGGRLAQRLLRTWIRFT